jgi:hypothetical protein
LETAAVAEAMKRRRAAPGQFRSHAPTLDLLCAILTRNPGVGEIEALGAAMRDAAFPWAAIAALAKNHLMLPSLWPALIDKRLVAPIPAALRRFLAERMPSGPGQPRNVFVALEDAFLANDARNKCIQAQAIEVIAALNAAGLEPGVLKGARLLLAGNSAFMRERCLRDIDLVVPRAAWPRAEAAIRALGYRGGAGAPDGFHEEASFLREGDAASIDLHIAPLTLHEPTALPNYLTTDGFWDRSIVAERDGIRFRHLPAGENLVHAILHTEVADLNFAAGDWALRYLYETAVISRDPAGAVDWPVLRALDGTAFGVPLNAHLHAAERLFGAALPGDPGASLWVRAQFLRCRLNARHPRSIRPINMLLHKLRQAMSEWYLRRNGFYKAGSTEHRGMELWRARLRAFGGLFGRYGRQLPRLLSGDRDSGLPPPRV